MFNKEPQKDCLPWLFNCSASVYRFETPVAGLFNLTHIKFPSSLLDALVYFT